MSRPRYRRSDPRDHSPRTIVARFAATCAECGGAIRAGESIEWTPRSRLGPAASRHQRCVADPRTEQQRNADRDDAALAQYERDALGEW